MEPTIERFLNNNIIVTPTHSLHGRLGNSQIDQGCFSLSWSGEPHSLSYRVTQLVKMLIALGDSLCKTIKFFAYICGNSARERLALEAEVPSDLMGHPVC